MPDEKIIENIEAVYRGVVSALPIKKDNVKKAMIKLTMSKPIIVEIK
jgi:ribosomal protein L1